MTADTHDRSGDVASWHRPNDASELSQIAAAHKPEV